MECTRKISDSIYWIGGSDRRLQLFENLFPIENGVSYDSYLIKDEKVAVMDTVDASIRNQYLENIAYVLGDRTIDYLVVQHMEPDHCANLEELVIRYPNMQIVANMKTLDMIHQYYPTLAIDDKVVLVKEGDTLSLGKHELTFVMAPMVHWPEVMVSYEKKEKILFSADAFGTFGAFNGHIFNDEIDVEKEWVDEARRYYTNIVGKFGLQVQALLKKAASLDIRMVCPLHGPIWRTNIDYILEKYQAWSTYTPEENGALLIYSSIYGNTESVVNAIACRLSKKGVKKIAVYDVSKTDVSVLVAESFKYSHIILANTTYNTGIFPKMDNYLNDIKALMLQKRTVAIIQNGSWALTSARLVKNKVEQMKDMTVLNDVLSIHSAVYKEDDLEVFINQILQSLADYKEK